MSSNFERLHEISNEAYAKYFSILSQKLANPLLYPALHCLIGIPFLFYFLNTFFRHMWIANIRARNLKNASQASLLSNVWTPCGWYLQVENWQILTTASFISPAKNDLVFFFRSKKINTIQDIKKPTASYSIFWGNINCYFNQQPRSWNILIFCSDGLKVS